MECHLEDMAEEMHCKCTSVPATMQGHWHLLRRAQPVVFRLFLCVLESVKGSGGGSCFLRALL